MPSDAVGYVAVHIPSRGLWQGFFAREAYRARGEELLRKAGGVVRDPRGEVGVADAMPGVAPADQAAVGALSALLARMLVLSGEAGPSRQDPSVLESAIGAASSALAAAAGHPWLLVTATPDRTGSAFHTEVRRLAAGSLDEAREAVAAEIQRTTDLTGLASSLGAGLRAAERGRS
ncbi:hypothetical protein ACE7GA_27025 (plasmid) [Roseomonas sp. CCTCC AB2023176]|uniref:hypothetical protein n=1 Tax=Roseomonas sp. CCTCC AB2023176 TaxID=3342640 RepID=UPI0035DB9700